MSLTFFVVLILGIALASELPEKLDESLGTGSQKEPHPQFISQRHRSDFLSELEAINRTERQIRFKGSYQDLPEGIPQPQAHNNNIHKHDHLSYFIQVDFEDAPIKSSVPIYSRGSSIYFPPEVVLPGNSQSSESDENDSDVFYIHVNGDNSLEDSSSSREIEGHVTSSEREVTYSPFYIPPDGDIIFTKGQQSSTETPTIFLANDFPEGHSQLTEQSSQSSENEGEDHDALSSPLLITSLPPLASEFSKETKRPSHTNIEPTGHESTSAIPSSFQTSSHPLPHPPTTNPQLTPTPATSIHDTPGQEIPFFIINNNDISTSNDQNTKPSSPFNPQNKGTSTPVISFPPRTILPPRKSPNRIQEPISKSHFGTSKSLRPKRPRTKGHSNNRREHSRTLDNFYPTLNIPPKTNFDCSDKVFGGYYADPETNCQVFHVCLGRRSAVFYCPRGTLFHQRLLVCDWSHKVKCHQNLLFATNQRVGTDDAKSHRITKHS